MRHKVGKFLEESLLIKTFPFVVKELPHFIFL